jgi:transmembrane sensor
MSDDLREGGAGTDEPWDELARWVAGESDAAEAARIRAWLDADPARARMLEGLTAATGRLEPGPPGDLDVEAALRRVHSRIAAMEPGAGADVRPIDSAPRRRRERVVHWASKHRVQAAAVVALLFGAALLWRAGEPGPAEPVLAATTHRTAVGQLDTLQLPDGALVVLAPASTLRVPAGYGATARIVELEGAALFDVVHVETQPFTVLAGGHTILDLGTTFTVMMGDEAVRVAVTAGTVQVDGTDARTAVDLRAGDRAELRADGRTVVNRGVVTEREVAWTQGRLVFEDATVARVAEDVRRWYGIELTWTDPATAQRRVTATFEDEDAARALDILAAVLGARIERRDGTAVIRTPDSPAPR